MFSLAGELSVIYFLPILNKDLVCSDTEQEIAKLRRELDIIKSKSVFKEDYDKLKLELSSLRVSKHNGNLEFCRMFGFSFFQYTQVNLILTGNLLPYDSMQCTRAKKWKISLYSII